MTRVVEKDHIWILGFEHESHIGVPKELERVEVEEGIGICSNGDGVMGYDPFSLSDIECRDDFHIGVD